MIPLRRKRWKISVVNDVSTHSSVFSVLWFEGPRFDGTLNETDVKMFERNERNQELQFQEGSKKCVCGLLNDAIDVVAIPYRYVTRLCKFHTFVISVCFDPIMHA